MTRIPYTPIGERERMALVEQKLSKLELDDTVLLICTIEAAHNLKDHTVRYLR